MRKVLAAVSLFAVVEAGSLTAAENLDKTLANVRSLATVIEAYAVDHGHYPQVSTYEELETLLVPRYLVVNEAIVDDWNSSYLYLISSEGCHYRVISAGADGRFEDSSVEMSDELPDPRVASTPEDDIIWQNHSFHQVPPGDHSLLGVRQTKRFSCP